MQLDLCLKQQFFLPTKGFHQESVSIITHKHVVAARFRKSSEFCGGNKTFQIPRDIRYSSYGYGLSADAKGSPKTVFPIINFPEDTFGLREDAVKLFKDNGIDQQDLIFMNEDIGAIVKNEGNKITLVDHNGLSALQMTGDNDFRPYIDAIIDHHEVEPML